MENNPNQIDTPEEATVEIVKNALLNWKIVTLWLSLLLAVILAISISFFKFGGLDMLKSIFGKQQTIIQTQGVKK